MTVNPYVLKPSGELAFYAGDFYPSKSTADGKKRDHPKTRPICLSNAWFAEPAVGCRTADITAWLAARKHLRRQSSKRTELPLQSSRLAAQSAPRTKSAQTSLRNQDAPCSLKCS